jgi:ABC-2 type transport system ATP-binding protein
LNPNDLAIETHDLTKEFPHVVAVKNLNLKIRKGGVFALVGPDGAGKSTTIRLLATLLLPSSGSAKVFGYDVVGQLEKVRPLIGYMSQRFNLYSDLTVLENLNFSAGIYQVPEEMRASKLPELLHFARLTEFQGRRAEHLSGGMKQKLALACTLIHEPEVLFLDEPTTGVDPLSRRDLWGILSRLHARGVTIFMTTPYMDEAEKCTSVAFMDQGEIILEGTPKKIKEGLPGDILQLDAQPLRLARQWLEEQDWVDDVEVYGELLQVILQDAERQKEPLVQGLKAQGVEVRTTKRIRASMESAFVHLMKLRRGK